MVGNQNIIEFVRGLGSPYVERGGLKLRFIDGLYRVALANKVVLTYLSRCKCDGECGGCVTTVFFGLGLLLDVVSRVSRVLEECGFRYAVFKTLRPFNEGVADVNILCLGSDDNGYRELVRVFEGCWI